MAKIETHCKDCEAVLGKPYLEVHEWLDAYAKEYNPFLYFELHRKFRHHDEGVEEAKKLFGHYGAQAAKLHIIRDCELYLGYFDIRALREDQIEGLYQRALNFCHDP